MMTLESDGTIEGPQRAALQLYSEQWVVERSQSILFHCIAAEMQSFAWKGTIESLANGA
jgi:hypothetical protein